MFEQVKQSDSFNSDWKQQARERFELWLDQIDTLETQSDDGDSDAPDLEAFFRELTALKSEMRTLGRKTAETFNRFTESLTILESAIGPKNSKMPSLEKMQLSLADLHIRFSRIRNGFNLKPKAKFSGIFSTIKIWSKSWDAQEKAFQLINEHLQNILLEAGVTIIETTGKPFDPEIMHAIESTDSPSIENNYVVEQVNAAYQVEDKIIKYANVIVCKKGS